jgi:hypothetical protein
MYMDTLTLAELVYRYFFFGWLFRNADRGNLFERSAAWRYNKQQSRWLPVYMRRWAAIILLLFCLAAFAESVHAHHLVFTFFYATSAMAVPVLTVCVTAWMMFNCWE